MLQIEFNISTLVNYFKKLDKSLVTKVVSEALSTVALEFKRDVLPHTPRDKGQLLNSWKVQKKDLTIEEGYTEIYAMYQEMGKRADGTHVIRNRPAGGKTFFMKSTIEENTKKYIKMYEDLVFKKLFK